MAYTGMAVFEANRDGLSKKAREKAQKARAAEIARINARERDARKAFYDRQVKGCSRDEVVARARYEYDESFLAAYARTLHKDGSKEHYDLFCELSVEAGF